VLSPGAVLLQDLAPDLLELLACDRLVVDHRHGSAKSCPAEVLPRHKKHQHSNRQPYDDEPKDYFEPLLAAHDVEHGELPPSVGLKPESLARGAVPVPWRFREDLGTPVHPFGYPSRPIRIRAGTLRMTTVPVLTTCCFFCFFFSYGYNRALLFDR